MDVDGVFTFTVDNLTQENATGDIAFDIGETGSVDITVASGSTYYLCSYGCGGDGHDSYSERSIADCNG